MLPPVSIEPLDLWLQVQHFTFWTNLSFACKTETLGSLYSHALLIPTRSSKSKNQVVHKQKFKVQRFMRGPGSIPIGGNILSLDFLFSRSKASDANIGIIANFV